MLWVSVLAALLALPSASIRVCAGSPRAEGGPPASEQRPAEPHRPEQIPLHEADPRDLVGVLAQLPLRGIDGLVPYDLANSLLVIGDPEEIARLKAALPLLDRPPIRITVEADFYVLEPGAVTTELLAPIPGIGTRGIFEGTEAETLAKALEQLAKRKLARPVFSRRITVMAGGAASVQDAPAQGERELVHFLEVCPRVSPFFDTTFGPPFQGSIEAQVTLIEGRKDGVTYAGRMVSERVTVRPGSRVAFWIRPTSDAPKALVVLLRLEILRGGADAKPDGVRR